VCWVLLQTVHETIRVKSAAWDDSGVLLYTTLNHIKYCLPNGDSGIIRTLDVPLYITRVSGGTIQALDRDGKVRTVQVDVTEYTFKLALLQRKYEQVRSGTDSGQGGLTVVGGPDVDQGCWYPCSDGLRGC
jgi:coatomer protein complex subunit alpha (xenin)